MSARWAFSCASCECRCAYWRVLLEEDEDEDEALVVVVESGFEVVAAEKEEGLVGCLWEVEGAIFGGWRAV